MPCCAVLKSCAPAPPPPPCLYASTLQVQNDNKPLWTRAARDVSKEEYDQFYKTTFR